MNQVSKKSLAASVLAGAAAALIAGGAASIAASQTAAAGQSSIQTETSGTTVTVNPQDANTPRHIAMGVGKSFILDLPRDAAEVVVGNPKIANAVVRSPRRLYILGVENGATTLFVMDSDGKKIASIEISIGRDINELKAILKTAMPSADIEVKTVNDTIILTGIVESAADAQKAEDIASAFIGYSVAGGAGASVGGGGVSFSSPTVIAGKVINSIAVRSKDQVMVKVTVAEVQRSAMKQLGVSLSGGWGKIGGLTGGAATPGGYTASAWGNDYGGNDTRFAVQGATGNFGGIVTALERHGVARVLAEPNVTAISGEAAKFTAGGQIQVLTTSQCTGGSTFFSGPSCQNAYTYKDYGVTLNFTPTVLSEGRIQLHLSTEVTEIDDLHQTKLYYNNLPAIRTRKHETTLELPSGGSIVSAGLIQQKSRSLILGQPGLMNLPVLGALFRSRDFQNEETELMIIVTPYIAKSLRSDQISRPDDGFANASDPQGYFLGKVNRVYSRPGNPQILSTYKGRVGFIQD